MSHQPHPRRHRVRNAFAHRETDRTPLFEIFQPFHPIHWRVCGRGLMTDMAMTWDAMAEGVSFGELVEAEAQAKVKMAEFFGLDIMHISARTTKRDFERPEKTGATTWRLGDMDYALDEARGMIFPTRATASRHQTISEDERRRQAEAAIESGAPPAPPDPDQMAVFRRVKELVAERSLDLMYMGEVGAGTGVAFLPPFQLLWFMSEPELAHGWIGNQAHRGFARTKDLIDEGCEIVALGGDVAGDGGPFVSPEIYREFILPVIQQHVRVVHDCGAYAVYTSDGNLWPLKDEIFFKSGVDGYKEVDYGAGMTMERLIEEGVKAELCVIGNVDARHTLCNKSPKAAAAFVRRCLELGRQSPGGHILHNSHSVHEDVKVENYLAAINAYRDFFGLELLPA